MVSKKHGKLKEHPILYIEETSSHHKPIIEKAKYEDGSEAIIVMNPISPNEKGWGFTLHIPSYEGLKVILQGLVDINGKEEVERELGIKIIGGEEKTR